VHLAYAREGTGHALIAARQRIPREQLEDPARRTMMKLPPGLAFRTKGQLAIDLIGEVLADGVRLDFACGDEVYGSCTQLREFLEARGQGYVLRVPSDFYLTLAPRAQAHLQGRGRPAAAKGPPVGSPLGRKGLQGPALVRLGLAGHCLPAPPPHPGHRRARILRRHRRPAAQTYRHPGSSTGPAGPATVPETCHLLAHPPPPGAPATGWPGDDAIKRSQPGTTSAPGSPAQPVRSAAWSGQASEQAPGSGTVSGTRPGSAGGG